MSRVNVDSRPVYIQVQQLIKARILSGEYPPGEKLPPVRDFAVEFNVNPNTLQRALSELEAEGLMETVSTVGKYITSDTDKIEALRRRTAVEISEKYLSQLGQIGINKSEAIKLLEE